MTVFVNLIVNWKGSYKIYKWLKKKIFGIPTKYNLVHTTFLVFTLLIAAVYPYILLVWIKIIFPLFIFIFRKKRYNE